VTRAFLADTSAWFAAIDPREERHQLCKEALRHLADDGLGVVTHNLVLAELHALLARTRGAATAALALDRAYADPSHRVVHVDADLQRAAVDRWLRVYRDVPFSLCDAVSFELMRQEGLRQAFTLDVHFALAGYEMLPVVRKVRRRK
jgi:uncharacterized protein